MYTSAISNNNFTGKIYFDKKLPPKMVNYANKILDTPINNKTIRQQIAKKSYDITFHTTSTKKATNPKLNFYSTFKSSNTHRTYTYKSFVRLNNNFEKNAESVSNLLGIIDHYKQQYNGYNNFGERITAWFKKVFTKKSRRF